MQCIGEDAITEQMCQKWLMKFCAGDFSLNDAPWSGRPVEVDSNQIKTLVEDKQHYTTREVANILEISKSIKLLLKMKNVSFILREKTKQTFWPTGAAGHGNAVSSPQGDEYTLEGRKGAW